MRLRESKVLFPLVIILAALVVAVVVVKAKPKPEAQDRPPVPAIELPAMVVTPLTRAVEISSQGTVQPKIEIDLVSQVSGRVDSVAESFVAGGYFAAGETMVQVDPRDYRVEVVRAESRVADARQALALERGRARQAKREWRDLGNEEGNALFLRKPQLAAAESAVKAAEADLEKARLNLERTTLSVPFDGRIRSTEVNLGQYVSPGAKVASVFSADVLEVRIPLTDRQVGLLPLLEMQEQGGVSAEVVADYGGEEYRWSGRLMRMEAAVDTRSRVRYGIVEVEISALGDGRPPLMVGQFARVVLAGREYDDVLEVPLQVLYEKDSLLTLDESHRLVLKKVRILQADQKTAWIRGVDPETIILLKRPGHVVTGMKVSPVFKEGQLQEVGQLQKAELLQKADQ